MERRIIEYLPLYMQEYREIKIIMDAEQSEFELIWPDAEDVLNNQFVSDATVVGVTRWENIFGIAPKETDTLEERKFRVLVKLNEQLPYTMQTLKEQLQRICGENGYRIILNAGRYILNVKLALENASKYQDVCDMLRRMVPANMIINVSMYNTYEMLSHYTHKQLAAFTQKKVREDVL